MRSIIGRWRQSSFLSMQENASTSSANISEILVSKNLADHGRGTRKNFTAITFVSILWTDVIKIREITYTKPYIWSKIRQLITGDIYQPDYWAGEESQKLVLLKMHSLDDVSAVIKHSSNVFCVNSTCEMRVTIVLAVSACGTYSLLTRNVYFS